MTREELLKHLFPDEYEEEIMRSNDFDKIAELLLDKAERRRNKRLAENRIKKAEIMKFVINI